MRIQSALTEQQAIRNLNLNESKRIDSIIPYCNNSSHNIDTVQFNNTPQLTPEEEIKRERIYQKILAILESNKIDIELAKNFQLLEKLAGGISTIELINLEPKDIDQLIKLLDDNLGFGDGLGFGEKDETDLEKLVNDIHNKIGYEKTGGSYLGQIWHNIKSTTKNIIGKDTIEKCQTPEELSEYFRKNYLENIKTLSLEDKQKAYAKMLRDFYYSFQNIDNKDKKINMISAISLLAGTDRGLIVDVIKNCFCQDKKALQMFGKALNENFESIVMTEDVYGEKLDAEEAAGIAHTAFKHMSSEDVRCALELMKTNATEYYNQYGKIINELRLRRNNGEQLTPDELKLLEQSELLYESRYAGAITGTQIRMDLPAVVQSEFLTTICNDTQELGIQEEVFVQTANYLNNENLVSEFQRERIETLLNNATANQYLETVCNKIDSQKLESSNSEKTTTIYNNDLNKDKNNLRETETERNEIATFLEADKGNISSEECNSEEKFKRGSQAEREILVLGKRDKTLDSEKLSASVDNEESQPPKGTLAEITKKGLKAAIEYQRQERISNCTFVKEIMNTQGVLHTLFDYAVNLFKNLNNSEQVLTFDNIQSVSSQAGLIKHMTPSALKDIDVRSYYISQIIEKTQESSNQKV